MEGVVEDGGLVDEVAVAVARALKISKNVTLGRKFVALSLEAAEKHQSDKEMMREWFCTQARQVAAVRSEVLDDVLERVVSRVAASSSSSSGFARGGVAQVASESKGGLLKRRQKSPGSGSKSRSLGLDALVKCKPPESSSFSSSSSLGVVRSGLGLDADAWEKPVRLESAKMTSFREFWNPPEFLVGKKKEENSQQQQQQQQQQQVAHENEDSSEEEEEEEEVGKAPDEAFDAEFYVDENEHDASMYPGDEKRWRERETSRKPPVSRVHADQAAWEENRLVTSGAVLPARARLEEEEAGRSSEEARRLVVRQARPPFLTSSGAELMQKQQEAVPTVKDPTSDMAKNARAGSALLRQLRQEKEKRAMRQRFWELGNHNRMGRAVMGDAGKKKTSEEPKKERETVFRSSSAAKTKKKISGEALPVASVREEFLTVVRENQVVVLVGETGSGKTTQVTQYLREDGYSVVACTQPRRVAAMSVAVRVAEEVGCEIGTEVGYAIRFEDVTSASTVIKYLTDGVLLRESLRDPDLDAYGAIVLDEAHERSLNTDVLLGILRDIVTRRRDLKLVVTSATLDAEAFSQFFGGRAPVFRIPGRTFPVETYFAKSVFEDYVDAAVKQILQIHLSLPPGDVLVFMTGQEDVEATCAAVADRVGRVGDDGVPPLLLLPMYSQLPAEMQAKIFEAAREGVRKCVVSTNVAETSLTVDGVKYVVDAGYCKLKVYNPKIGMDALQVTPVSMANAKQRAGRAGRTAPGYCYRLYTERQFKDELLATQVPEIQRANLASVVLLLKSLKVKNILDFRFLDPPPRDNILNSMYQLWVLGALDDAGNLSALGRKMVDFPLDPALAKMLVAARGCSAQVLAIVSTLSVPNIFFRPKDREEESDASREKFFVPESDHLTLLNVYEQWRANSRSDSWCEAHYLQPKALKKAREIETQLEDLVVSKNNDVPLVSCEGDWDVVRRAICSAYFFNAARRRGLCDYVTLLSAVPCHLHPSSALFGMGASPDHVVYHELVMTSREYMKCTTAVEPEWLADLGGIFFSIRNDNPTTTTTTTTTTTKRKRDDAATVPEEARRPPQNSKICEPGRRTAGSRRAPIAGFM
ncbi:hypothetical protein CTAYLR_001315 [Chrysophaeum taylorii]|uniref:RNA helicase n=1 Tax=Chrysophaeum taylorii TaxID=2483200 RepID=A0AAD7U755_9STRA|nr:hypothetical protein CTAYLR_001315 [Chrysophaeum taylorii]